MFPNLLIELKRHKYSQKGLAVYIGISERAMSSKMNDKMEFTLAEMEKIQSAFPECSLDYLFTRYGQKE